MSNAPKPSEEHAPRPRRSSSLHDSIEGMAYSPLRDSEMSGAIRGGMFDVLSAQNERISALEDRVVRAEWAAVAGVALAGMSGVFTLVTVLLLAMRSL